MASGDRGPKRYVEAIRDSGLTIYSPIKIGDPVLWIPAPELEAILDKKLKGLSLFGLKLRTRSKVAKENVCRALGYPVPDSFKKTQPRFPGQMFDTYVQKSNNLQVWNEELSSTRRYVLIRVDEREIVSRVKVVTGDALAPLDTTGTLTQKYQATCIPSQSSTELIANLDTDLLRPFTVKNIHNLKAVTPISHPSLGQILSIASVFERLAKLVGETFKDTGSDRNRGAALHALVCKALGYTTYQDDGQFPDIRHQLLEVKLQTSPTIDLGLVRPASADALDVPMIGGKQIRHCDTRYAIFYGSANGKVVKISNFILTTGEAFFSRFPQFKGKVLNKKLQIPLPADFFLT
ncbi:MAG: hypothetical protein NTZ72_13770 [Afipia sp.]|nr:hypothetical protein [Afipia sp.]